MVAAWKAECSAKSGERRRSRTVEVLATRCPDVPEEGASKDLPRCLAIKVESTSPSLPIHMTRPPTQEPAMSSTAGGREKAVKRQYDLVNPATLDCPICKEPLCPPIFQCRNGHIACSECCATISQGCPSCSESTTDIRCLAMESVLESVQVSCKHARRGCKERLKHFQIAGHEAKLCKYADAYLCPVSDCGHETPMVKMLDHITNVHGGWNFVVRSSPTPSVKFSASIGKRWKRFMIISSTSKQKGSSLLVHFEERESLGVLFFCTSIGISKVFYNLKVKPHDGSASYVLETTAPFLQTKGESSCKRLFLLIPTGIDCDETRCKFEVELSFPENN